MEEKKSLVEQLRVLKSEGCTLCSVIGAKCAEMTCDDCNRILADRIEREYMPRPLFEDGEPVQFGDEFYYKGETLTVCGFRFPDDGSFWLLHSLYSSVKFAAGERVKRPKPDVVDADGVKIAEGDTVYLLPEFHEYAGKGYEKSERKCGLSGVEYGEELTVFRVDGKKVKFYGTAHAWCPPSWLTHKQPDSLERIREDVAKDASYYWGCQGIVCSECPAKIDGMWPSERYKCGNCSDAMTLDLIERTKAVCEREGGKA